MRDRCLRTVLISPIGAPERSSARLSSCFCASVTPAAGAIQLAEPPPDSSTSTRSSAPARCASCSDRSARLGPRRPARDVRLRSPRSVASAAVAVSRGGETGQALRRQAERVEIVPFGRGRHRGCALAGGEADDAPFRRRRQMRASTTSGCARATAASKMLRRRGRRSVIDSCAEMNEARLSIQSAQKKTPAKWFAGAHWFSRPERRDQRQLVTSALSDLAEALPGLALEAHQLQPTRSARSRSGWY